MLLNKIEFINVLQSLLAAENDADIETIQMIIEGLMNGHGVKWNSKEVALDHIYQYEGENELFIYSAFNESALAPAAFFTENTNCKAFDHDIDLLALWVDWFMNFDNFGKPEFTIALPKKQKFTSTLYN
jgi:hypothetical protein